MDIGYWWLTTYSLPILAFHFFLDVEKRRNDVRVSVTKKTIRMMNI